MGRQRVLHARDTALAEGHGYRLLNEPGEIDAVQYPPLLPMIVAAHQLILGTNDYLQGGVRAAADLFRRLSGSVLADDLLLWRVNFCARHTP